MRYRWVVAATVAAVGVGLGSWAGWKNFQNGDERMIEPPKTLVTHLLDTVPDLHDRNGVSLRDDLRLDDVGAIYFEAKASATDGPDGYAIHYEDGECGAVDLPPGRIVMIAHEGLWVESIVSVLPLEPLPFEEARTLARSIADRMTAAGWDRYVDRPDVTPEVMAENLGGSRHDLAAFRVCGRPGTDATVAMKGFNDSPSGYSIPPAAVGDPLPDDAPDLYLIEVSIGAYDVLTADSPDLIDEARRVVEARRLAVNGDRHEKLPLQVWLDDPDWRPQD